MISTINRLKEIWKKQGPHKILLYEASIMDYINSFFIIDLNFV